MQFGLWFEPEMVNPDSDVARAHPEWIMAARADWPVESRSQQVLNLGIPGAYEHVKGQMLAVLDEYDIGYIKWDHNRDLIEAGNQTDGGRPGGARADPRLLPAARRAAGRPPRPGDRVLLVRRRPRRPGGARAHRPGVGLGQHRPARPPAHAALDHPAGARRSTSARTSPRAARTRPGACTTSASGPRRRSSATSASSGTSPRPRDRGARRARRVGRVLQGAPRRCCSAATLVRMDGYDDNVFVHGVVAPDRSQALFAMAVVGSVSASPGPRLRFRGLDPGRLLPRAPGRRRRPRPVGSRRALVGRRARTTRAVSSPAPRWPRSGWPRRSSTPTRSCCCTPCASDGGAAGRPTSCARGMVL